MLDSPTGWLILLLLLGAGILIGLLIARYASPAARELREVREERDRLQQEMNDYRLRVHGHFEQTSQLFADLTGRYRAVYDHLSHGARDLCNRPLSPPKLDLPEKQLLPSSSDRNDQTRPSAPHPAAPGDDTRAPGPRTDIDSPRASADKAATTNEDESTAEAPGQASGADEHTEKKGNAAGKVSNPALANSGHPNSGAKTAPSSEQSESEPPKRNNGGKPEAAGSGSAPGASQRSPTQARPVERSGD